MTVAHRESTGNAVRASVYDTILQLGLLEKNSMMSDWMFEGTAGPSTQNPEPKEEELSTDTESVYSSPSMREGVTTSASEPVSPSESPSPKKFFKAMRLKFSSNKKAPSSQDSVRYGSHASIHSTIPSFRRRPKLDTLSLQQLSGSHDKGIHHGADTSRHEASGWSPMQGKPVIRLHGNDGLDKDGDGRSSSTEDLGLGWELVPETAKAAATELSPKGDVSSSATHGLHHMEHHDKPVELEAKSINESGGGKRFYRSFSFVGPRRSASSPKKPKPLRRPKSLRPDPSSSQSSPFRPPRFSPTIEVPDGDNSDSDTYNLPLSASSAEDPPTPDALLREYAAGRRPLSFSSQIQTGRHHSDEDPFSAAPSASSTVPVTRPLSFNGSYLAVPGVTATVQRSASAIHQRGRQVPFPTNPIFPVPLSVAGSSGDQKLGRSRDLYRQDFDVATGESIILGDANIGRRRYRIRQQDTGC
ncbi:uncharacterized protein BT62DRAFT_922893 [Guyanagaster necrorhizus]|uniref:Uncharacterized protein n=1 Tax=Guyanagaster necrorhizus TaxID=856835 RepID=A0A9P7VLC1_9AGAR|nr:uncharacterized protein BT62DRAFT_922893 [Guyanagaster necrorhizus MCA 3950]KAG7442076.1 hypothetical protein BT62DRAFT_922893 [Guyanagaster necrorhizus MCA 3950]